MQDLKRLTSQLGVTLSATQVNSFERYQEELLTWNKQVNLTRIVNPEAVLIKHFFDSLTCLLAVPILPQKVIDVGSGAGFPGLPLKIVYPHIQLTLVEATGKKVAFLNHVADTLGLQQVTVLQARAEDIGQQATYREQYHLAVARAVAPLNVLAEYLLPLLAVDGLMVAQKGTMEHLATELSQATQACQRLGGHFRQTLSVTLPDMEAERNLVMVKKIASTPTQYPRRAGRPIKNPLK